MRIRMFVLTILFLCTFSVASSDQSNPQWYRCIVNSSSHMGFYTFKINTIAPCEIYWREIDTSIEITQCDYPVLAGLKPSAQDKYSIVWFNLETGAFYDYLSGVKDRGVCTAHDKEPGAFSSNKQ